MSDQDRIEKVYLVDHRKGVMDTVAVVYRIAEDKRRRTSFFYCASTDSAERLKGWLELILPTEGSE